MPSSKSIVNALRWSLHLTPLVLLLLGVWLTALTFVVLNFVFYVKTFKLEVYLQDLEDKSQTEDELKSEIKTSIRRWKMLTFLDEYRTWREKP